MIGLSLSLCVADILRGRAQERDVDLIVAGTRIREDDPEHFNYVLDNYAENYWHMAPNEGKAIARRLWDAGKVFQPRAHGGQAPTGVGGQHWVHSTNQPVFRFVGREVRD